MAYREKEQFLEKKKEKVIKQPTIEQSIVMDNDVINL